jgi:hypothetical protein
MGGVGIGGPFQRGYDPRMAEQPQFAEGHEHTQECAVLYAEWKRLHEAVLDPRGRYTRDQRLQAHREREMFERQLRALGCSGEALRRLERDAEIREHGRPLLGG